MPLRLDDLYRGPRALHVRDHRKLGKPRTLIRQALSVANWLIDDPDVTKVDFGKMIGGYDSGKFTHRTKITRSESRLHVMLVAKNAAQMITVTVKTPESAARIAEEVERRWAQLNAAND